MGKSSNRSHAMEEVIEAIDQVEFRPRYPLARIGDFFEEHLFYMGFHKMLLYAMPSLTVRGNPYPPYCRELVLEASDGAPLPAIIALKDGEVRPGVVLVHGFLQAKFCDFYAMLLRLFHEKWGYNVMVFDMRGWGESQRYSAALPTGCWKEAEDIQAAARYLGGLPEVSRVGVLGYSYGCMSVLRAVSFPSEKQHITGGAMGFCGAVYNFAEWAEFASDLTNVNNLLPMLRYGIYMPMFFIKGKGRYVTPVGLMKRSERIEGISWKEMSESGSPGRHIRDANVPTLAFHGEGDPLVPASMARRLQDAAQGNPLVRIELKPGGHAFFLRDKDWMKTVIRTFFDHWARTGD